LTKGGIWFCDSTRSVPSRWFVERSEIMCELARGMMSKRKRL